MEHQYVHLFSITNPRDLTVSVRKYSICLSKLNLSREPWTLAFHEIRLEENASAPPEKLNRMTPPAVSGFYNPLCNIMGDVHFTASSNEWNINLRTMEWNTNVSKNEIRSEITQKEPSVMMSTFSNFLSSISEGKLIYWWRIKMLMQKTELKQ